MLQEQHECYKYNRDADRRCRHFVNLQLGKPVVKDVLEQVHVLLRIGACHQIGLPEHFKGIQKDNTVMVYSTGFSPGSTTWKKH